MHKKNADFVVAARRSSLGEVGVASLFDGVDGSLLQTFRDPNPEPGLQFDTDSFAGGAGMLATIGDSILIGDPKDDSAVNEGGAVFVFDRSDGINLTATLLSAFSGVSSSPAGE